MKITAVVDVFKVLELVEGRGLTLFALRVLCHCAGKEAQARERGLMLIKISQTGLAKRMQVSPQMVHKAWKELLRVGVFERSDTGVVAWASGVVRYVEEEPEKYAVGE